MGDRANAIKVAEAHVRRLREEFDLEPDREILATIERIRRGELPAQAVAVVPAAAAPRPGRHLRERQHLRLKRLPGSRDRRDGYRAGLPGPRPRPLSSSAAPSPRSTCAEPGSS